MLEVERAVIVHPHEPRVVAVLDSPGTGTRMELSSDQPGLDVLAWLQRGARASCAYGGLLDANRGPVAIGTEHHCRERLSNAFPQQPGFGEVKDCQPRAS